MTYTERHIVDSYSNVLAGLSSMSRIELIKRLTKSLEITKQEKKGGLHLSFGAWKNKSVEEIHTEIKQNRKFAEKDLTL